MPHVELFLDRQGKIGEAWTFEVDIVAFALVDGGHAAFALFAGPNLTPNDASAELDHVN